MPTIKQLVAQLETRKAKAAAEIAKLNEAIGALRQLGGRGAAAAPRKHRKMSAAARRRIAAAQRARWAKYRAAKGQ